MKKTLSILSLIIILVVSMCSMVGCGGDSEVLIAGTEPTYPPFESADEDGNIVGFDVDLLNAIAEDQGFEVKFNTFEFDGLISAVKADSCDIIAAAMNVTPERAEEVDFTETYFASAKTILVAKDNTTITSPDDFTKDMKVAAQIGTSEADYVQSLAADGKIKEAVVLNQTTQCILQLQNGDVDAVVMDAPVANIYLAKNGDTVKALDTEIDPADMAFAVKKGNTELLDKLNAGLKNVVDNGTYDQLVAKWFAE